MNCTRKILTFRAGFSRIRHTTAGKCVAVAGCVLFLSVLSLTNGLHAQQPEEKPIHYEQKFSKEVSRKARRYQSRIDRRTEKTLVRLSRWETKIRQSLQKVSPETEQQLFGSQRLTFQSMLQEYRERFSSVRKIEAHYDGYLDRLGTTIKYLEGGSTSDVNSELTHLSQQVNQSEYHNSFKNFERLKDIPWQKSGMIGISRQYPIGRKRKGEVKILYDLLHNRDITGGAPVVVRMGYKL